MPRKPRFFVSGIGTLIIQRAHDYKPVFFKEHDYEYFLVWLKRASEKYHCKIHAYALAARQITILATPGELDGISRMIQYVGRLYVPYINQSNHTRGSLWDKRYKACLIQDKHILQSMAFVERPLQQNRFVQLLTKHKWTSYHINAGGGFSPLISPHKEYMNLADTNKKRAKIYKALLRSKTNAAFSNSISEAVESGTPFGDENFKKEIAQTLHRSIGYTRRGRPKSLS